jgi:YbaB/EbfC DNA-binding family
MHPESRFTDKSKGNTMEPTQWLADYDERLTHAARTAQEASARLRQVGGKAVSPRGEATVTVSASGALEDLTLTPAARALEVDQLARLILDTTRQAQRAVGAQVVDIMTEYFGEGTALDMVKQNLPPAAEVDAELFAAPAGMPHLIDDRDCFTNPPEITR